MTVAQDELDAIGIDADRRWHELEEACRFPDDLYRRLARSGVFRQLVPTSLGGEGSTPNQWFERGIALAYANGSLGWIASQGAAMVGVGTAVGSPEFHDLVRTEPALRLAAVNTAVGRYRPVEGGDEVSGRWSFTSGCEGASVIGGLVLPDGSNDRADAALAFFDREQVTVERDWNAVGLRGTGSHTVVADRARCVTGRVLRVYGPATIDGPARVLAARNGPWPIAMSVAATQLGIARRAIDEAVAIVDAKAPAPAFLPLRDSQSVQRTVSALDAAWLAARAGAREHLDELWSVAGTEGELGIDLRRRLAIIAHHANATAADIVDEVWRLTGTSGVAIDHPIARCLRDSRPLIGHVSANERVLEFADQVRQRGAPLAVVIV